MVAVAPATPPPPVAALVVLDDRRGLRLESSRRTFRVRVGKAVTLDLEVVNNGEDVHDLTLRRAGSGTPLATSGDLRPSHPGTRPSRVRRPLRPGTYVLFCSVAAGTSRSHEALGMAQTITVTPRPRRR